MIKVGVHAGTLLFDGSSNGNEYNGIAYIFDGRCGRYPYEVHGPILEGGSRVLLHGDAPVVDGTCKIKRHLRHAGLPPSSGTMTLRARFSAL